MLQQERGFRFPVQSAAHPLQSAAQGKEFDQAFQ